MSDVIKEINLEIKTLYRMQDLYELFMTFISEYEFSFEPKFSSHSDNKFASIEFKYIKHSSGEEYRLDSFIIAITHNGNYFYRLEFYSRYGNTIIEREHYIYKEMESDFAENLSMFGIYTKDERIVKDIIT